LHCVWEPGDGTVVVHFGEYLLGKIAGGQVHKIRSPLHDEVARIMCGEIYDTLYEPSSLADVASDFAIVQRFLDAESEILGAPARFR
jgi:hypothetical protein